MNVIAFCNINELAYAVNDWIVEFKKLQINNFQQRQIVMYKILIVPFIVFMIVTNVYVVAADTINESYQTIDTNIAPPNGTQINIELSEHYKIPVANGVNGTFWYAAGSWHTSEEILNLSASTQIYGAFSDSKIPMPVNFLIIVLLAGIMYYVSNRVS